MTRLILPVSGPPANWLAGAMPGSVLYGTTGNDQLAANASNMTLVGNGGDDTFIVYDASDVVVEPANSGISTVETWGSGYTLPANVENLTLEGAANAFAVGNSLDNIITANAGNDTIDGGGGSDLLIGGPGDDTFVVWVGYADDEIANFRPGANSGDVVDLRGVSFTSFAGVQAAMTQSGADTVLNLGGGQAITFDNTAVGSFSPDNFNLPFSPAGLSETFDDEFNTLSLDTGVQSGTWMTSYYFGGRTLPSNGELEEYMDPDFAGTASQPLGVNPFSDSNGILTITAQPASPAVAPYIGNMPYTSGLLTTEDSFSQTYGYWEIRAELPKGDGLWPAFWLLPADHSYPPEVDIFEVLGNDPTTVYDSFHGVNGDGYQQVSHVSDLSVGFHTFGFDWTPSTMTWYVDGVETAQTATPAYMDKPMYMLIDLAVGGRSAGAPDASTSFPANLNIDYVRVYSGTSTVDPPPSPAASVPANLTGSGVSEPLMTNINTGALVLDKVSAGQMTYQQIGALGPEWQFEGEGSFLGDGKTGFLLWNSNSGAIVIGEDVAGAAQYTSVGGLGPEWQFEGNGPILGQSTDDFLLWNSSSGGIVVGSIVQGAAQYSAIGGVGAEWQFAGVGDFLGDGNTGFLLHNGNSGGLVVGEDVGGAAQYTTIGGLGAEWTFVGVGDLLGHGHADFLIRNQNTNALVVGEVAGGTAQYTQIGGLGPEWQVVGTGNFDGASPAELLLQNGNNGGLVIGTISNGGISYNQVGGLGAEWNLHAGHVPTLV